MSILYPGRLNGGSVATTNTAAMFLTCMLAALFDPVWGTVIPIRSRAEMSVCAGKTVCELSPVPRNPTTSPYPTSWLSRMPSMVATSLTRARSGRDSAGTSRAASANARANAIHSHKGAPKGAIPAFRFVSRIRIQSLFPLTTDN